MIADLFLYILGFIFNSISTLINLVAANWTIWPADLLAGLTYFFTSLMNFNPFFPIDTLLIAIKFLVGFDIMYIGVRLVMKFLNYIRGSGGIDM